MYKGSVIQVSLREGEGSVIQASLKGGECNLLLDLLQVSRITCIYGYM